MFGRNAWSRRWLGFAIVLSSSACGNVEQAKDVEVDQSHGGESALQPGDGSDPTPPTCEAYCDSVMSACAGNEAVYVSQSVCLAVCARFEPGEAAEPTGNTLACRALHATLAEHDPARECSAAGPGGGDRCGSDCEAYCALFSRICPELAAEQASVADCRASCAGLVDQPNLDLTRDHGGDTVECRLVHVSAASVGPIPHCEHARLAPTAPWCVEAD
jgi:hypothetical protein